MMYHHYCPTIKKSVFNLLSDLFIFFKKRFPSGFGDFSCSKYFIYPVSFTQTKCLKLRGFDDRGYFKTI